jgi:sulfate adenylyltransferase subunit 1
MTWYKGKTLLHLLETLPLRDRDDRLPARFPVQYVIRPRGSAFPDYRAFAGRIASGTFRTGDAVTVLPSGTTSTIRAIDEADRTLTEAAAPRSVAIRLTDEVDVSRGDMIVPAAAPPRVSAHISLLVCWLNRRPLSIGAKYILRHTADELFGVVKDVYFKININTLENILDDKTVCMNDIAHIALRTSRPLKYDLYEENRITGSLVLIDEATLETVGAGMIVEHLEDRTYAI